MRASDLRDFGLIGDATAYTSTCCFYPDPIETTLSKIEKKSALSKHAAAAIHLMTVYHKL